MKQLTPNLIRIAILIIMVQSVFKETDLYAAGNAASNTTQVSGRLTSLTIETLPPSCQSRHDGVADLTVTGSDVPYTILWSDGSVSEDLSNVPAGSYQVTVTGQSGEQLNAEVIIPSTPFIFETKDVTCYGASNGGVELTALTDLRAWSFEWSNGSRNHQLRNVPGGTYSLRVTDETGCASTYAFMVYEPQPVALEMKSTDANCATGGTAEVVVTGGEEPFLFQWSDGSEIAAIDRLEPGDYSVVVTDSRLCSATGKVQVGGKQGRITLMLTAVSASCAEDEDGSIDLHVSGGTAPYTYLWSNGNTAEDQLLVAPGMYAVTVTDAVGCSQQSSIELDAPERLTASVSEFSSGCAGAIHGLTVTATGGSMPYAIPWSDGSKGHSHAIEADGVYNVTVTDAAGCSVQMEHEVKSVAPVEISEQVTHPSGPDKADGGIAVQIRGGAAPFIYEWSNGSSGNKVDGLRSGIYSLLITDATGCSFDYVFELGLGFGEETAATAVRAPEQIQESIGIRVLNSGMIGQLPAIAITAAQDGNYEVTVFDLAGRMLTDLGSIEIRKGEQSQIDLNAGTLKAGVYIVKVSTSGLTRAVKLNIIN